MFVQILILILLGGLLELDRTAALHSLAGEPIVVGPVAGWLLGDTLLGVQVGILLQLFFLGNVSIGGSTPPDGTLSALVVAGTAGIFYGKTPEVSREALTAGSALLLMVPASRIGGWVDGRIKESNVAKAHRADDDVPREGSKALENMVHVTLIKNFVLWTVVSAVSLGAGALLMSFLLRIMTADFIRALEGSAKLLPLVAAGVALSAIKLKRANWWFAGACLGLLAVSVHVG